MTISQGSSESPGCRSAAVWTCLLLAFFCGPGIVPAALAQDQQPMLSFSGESRAGESLSIVEPADQSAVQANDGKIQVRVAIPPQLALDAGQRIELFLDGRLAASGQDTAYTLAGIERGTHRLQARIVEATGELAAESKPVIFHAWHASRLFPSRQ